MNNESGESREIVSELNERLINGIFKENPTFVLLLGMCPTLAVTTNAANGLGMGLTTLVVLAMSNLIISALRKVIPSKVRIPAFIVIIASFVTIVEMLLKAYIPSLYNSLGIYIPLIVVNCIILGRAEAYAYSHGPLLSLFDGIGMGMGFTVALTIIGAFREILGAGTIFSRYIMPKGYVPVSIFIMAPGAFFVLAMLTAIQNAIKHAGEKRGRDMSAIQSGCGGNCLECSKECKAGENATGNNEAFRVSEDAEPVEIAEPKEAKEVDAFANVEENAESAELAEVMESEADVETEAVEDVKEAEETEEAEEVEETEVIEETAEPEENELITENVEALPQKRKPSLFDRVFDFFDGKKKISKEEVKDETEEFSEDIPDDSDADMVESLTDSAEADADSISEKKMYDNYEESLSVSEETSKGDAVSAEDIKPEASDNTENEVENTQSDEDYDELELLNLDDYKRAINKTLPSGKRSARKKASFEKAQALFNKAGETLKEEGEADD